MRKAPLGRAGHDVGAHHVREGSALAPSVAEGARALDKNVALHLSGNGTVIHPEPRRGVYSSAIAGITVPLSAGTTVPLSEKLWHRLHLDKAKAVAQCENGAYAGKRETLTRSEFKRHLNGEITLALTVLNYQKALFAALDVDARFPALLPRVRELSRSLVATISPMQCSSRVARTESVARSFSA